MEEGHSQAEAARHFKLHPDTVGHWIKLKKTTGSLRAIPVPRGPHKLPLDALEEYVKEHPDAFLREIAAQCGKKVLAPFGYHGTCDAKLFNFWLEKFPVPLLKPGQIVIMDNASIHKTNTTQSIIDKAGCKLLFLPPYSPDLNPIEHFWAN